MSLGAVSVSVGALRSTTKAPLALPVLPYTLDRLRPMAWLISPGLSASAATSALDTVVDQLPSACTMAV